MKRALVIVLSIASCLLLVGSASAFPPVTWHSGDEVAALGHSFSEEYWTNSSVNVSSTSGGNASFSVSYVNYSGVQAFLLSLNTVDDDNITATVPFQMFGMHYMTPEKREVFIGAILAFMMVFDDTHNGSAVGSNNMPDPLYENVTYVFPFGAANATGNSSYSPQVNVLPVQKLGAGHYRFGMQYLNMYAFVTNAPYLSWVLKTGIVAKFSEFKVVYDITIDNKTGETKAETFYTIGQVTELYGFLLGIPFAMNPRALDPNLGISVVHLVSVFTSKYQGASGNTTKTTFNPNITRPVNEDILLKVGDDSERAMKIGTRGTFDLINETNGTTVKANQVAYTAIVAATTQSLWLVGWQLGFAAGAMSMFAYGLSDYVKSQYTGPKNLMDNSLNPSNPKGFTAHPLWYAVAFPHWQGYRIVHDPTYIAYTYVTTEGQPQIFNIGIILALAIIIIPIVIIIALVVMSRRRLS